MNSKNENIELDLTNIKANISCAKDLLNNMIEYNILINDLKDGELNKEEMLDIFNSNFKYLEEYDDIMSKLNKDNNDINIFRLKERLSSKKEVEEEN